MSSTPQKVLLIGFGNPGRLDDGLGPAVAEAIGCLDLAGVTVDADYQLTVEDAAAVAEHDVVVFADADVACAPPFYFERVTPANEVSFSTHSVSPGAVVGLAQELFGATTDAWLLGVRGYEFNAFGESLSDGAQRNLALAIEFLVRTLGENRFRDIPRTINHSASDRTTDPVGEVQPCETANT